MSKKDLGVLVMYEWYEAMDPLILSEYKKLQTAIYRFQKFGEEPPEFTGKTKPIATMIFAQLRRRAALACYGKMGAEKRLSAKNEEDEGDGLASSQASSQASSSASSSASRGLEAKEKKIENKEKKIYPYPRSCADKGAHKARYGGSAAKSESVSDWDEFFENAAKQSLGDAY